VLARWLTGVGTGARRAVGAGEAWPSRRGPIAEVDHALLSVWAAVLLVGLVMVYSASVALSDGDPRYANYHSYSFVLRHAMALWLGALAALVAFQIPMAAWQRLTPWFMGLSLVLLVLVLMPFISKINGAQRWLPLGFFNFQPSELAKLSVALYAAHYMVRKMALKEHFFRAVLPMAAVLALIGLLLLAEPDMGAFLVIVVIAMGVLFLGGVNARVFVLLGLLLLLAFVAMIWFSDWRRERIFAYLNPWDPQYALGRGYQLSHALIALGRGGLWGVGLGASVEKLHWLPEAHTDFLLSVIGEEFGLLGVWLVIAAHFWMARRVLHIGRQAIALERVFAGLAAQGVGLWFGFQAFINVGVNLGALPTKGLTLPFMSYGGSALLMTMIAMAMVLRVDHENRHMMRGGRA
jgi:cell division protein FtsW